MRKLIVGMMVVLLPILTAADCEGSTSPRPHVSTWQQVGDIVHQVENTCIDFRNNGVEELRDREASISQYMAITGFPSDLAELVGTFFKSSRTSAQRSDDRSAVIRWCRDHNI